MNATASRVRRARGRVLVINDPALREHLLAVLDQPVDEVIDLYDALGALARATAREPIVTLVARLRDVAQETATAVESIRRVDPAVRLVLLAPREARDRAERALHDGFDACILGDGDIPALARILCDHDLDGDLIELSVSPPEPPAPSPSPAPTVNDSPREAASPPLSQPPRTQPLEAPVIEVFPRHVPTTAGAPLESSEIGDIDLVRAVLAAPELLPELALALLRQESGLHDAVLIEESPAPGDGLAVEVGDGPHRFGWLRASASLPRLKPWANWLAIWLRLAHEHVELHGKAYSDALTGAWNRRFVDEQLPAMLEHARREHRSVAIMLFDIDDLKKYNDNFGHDAGDELLRETVKLLQSVVRKGDRVCRLGGDEFLVIFADPEGPRKQGSGPLDTIEKIVHRFHEQVCRLRLPQLGPEAPGPVSVSAGMATFPWDGYEAVSLLKLADQLALESKRRGKNAVTFGPGFSCCNHDPVREPSENPLA